MCKAGCTPVALLYAYDEKVEKVLSANGTDATRPCMFVAILQWTTETRHSIVPGVLDCYKENT